MIIKKREHTFFLNYKNIKFKLLEHNFGNVSLERLLKLKSEIELYNFFLNNREKYSKVCDVGANVGMHSIFLSKIFSKVTAYEPYSLHLKILRNNKKISKLS